MSDAGSPPAQSPAPLTLGWRAGVLLAAFCGILFGYNLFSGRPLSLHEARLPETSREMMARGDWLLPRSGGRPWLERPPLPHWLTIATSLALHRTCDQVWVVRLPAALAGMITVLLTAYAAARLVGRGTALCAGLVLATAYEFYTYATLAEDDIYLAALVAAAMACFVRAEFGPPALLVRRPPSGAKSLFTGRDCHVAGFFVLAGLTNLVKGPLVGAAMIGAACGSFVLWEAISGDTLRLRRYLWLWGLLLFAAITVAWPAAVHRRYPDVTANWLFDYANTNQYDQPIWYYVVELLGRLMPWTPAVLVGLVCTAGAARRRRGSPQRFLWCWAIAPLILLSLPHRKHHHYLVPVLAPWAILGALGLAPIARAMFGGTAWSRRPAFGLIVFGLPGMLALWLLRSKVPGPPSVTLLLGVTWLVCVGTFYVGLHRRSAAWTLSGVLLGIVVAACWAQTYVPDMVADDTAFLRRADAEVPPDAMLTVNADLHGELDFFRNQFYVRPSAILLHNLTFLRDQRLAAMPDVYVITRARDVAFLDSLGRVEQVDQSAHTRREKSPADRFTLFRVRFSPALARYPAPTPESISTLQAMGRAAGPYCGPPPPR